jgi:glutathione S-transferase
MDFYHTPASSSQATHILLREAKLDFRPHKVDIFNHTLEDGSDYTRVNPNGYVPALVIEDGTLLTENAAIIDWIASQSRALLPGGELGRTRHLQMLAFLSTEVQKPFIPLFFLEDEAEQARLREAGGRFPVRRPFHRCGRLSLRHAPLGGDGRARDPGHLRGIR